MLMVGQPYGGAMSRREVCSVCAGYGSLRVVCFLSRRGCSVECSAADSLPPQPAWSASLPWPWPDLTLSLTGR